MSEAKKSEVGEPEKLELESIEITEHQRANLVKLFPNVVTEGGRVNFDKLRHILGDLIDSGKERYGLTWAGKSDCLLTIQRPSTATLLPDRERSVNFDITENAIIEGDNLEVLKLLQKSYLGKVKMIYIDPPYNTGNDFIYPDDYSERLETYLTYTGQTDEEGRKFSTNLDTDGRFHSKWLSMMYPRLFLARNLLREDGAIFISIDDGEFHNLRHICNEVFGEENFLGVVARKTKLTSNKGTFFAPSHEYLVVYGRDKSLVPTFSDPEAQEDADYLKLFKFEDSRGKFNEVSLYMPSLDDRPNQRYFITCPDGTKVIPPEGKVFRWTEATFLKNKADDRVVFKQTKTSPLLNEKGEQAPWNIYTKLYLHERQEDGLRPVTFFDKYPNSVASKELIELGIDFSFAKPWQLIAWAAKICDVRGDDIILDFFAGSGSTGQAVLELNRHDGASRRFILVQLPEQTEDPKLPTISSICEERIRRVISRTNAEDQQKSQATLFATPPKKKEGFRSFKLASSSFRAWNPSKEATFEHVASQLPLHVSNIQTGRAQESIFFELLLKSGFELSASFEPISLKDKVVFSAQDGTLLVCLEKIITKELISEMAALNPVRVICLDSSFEGNDQLKVNAVETFKAKGITFKTV